MPMESTQSGSSKRRERASIDTPFDTEFSIELSGALDSDEAHQLENVVNLDAEVLASLVIQLRTNLTSATRERDEVKGDRDALIRDLAVMQTRLQELEGAHEREVEMLNEMVLWKKRCEDAEEQVGMLRGKVEESRRAVMTLQNQSRRQSQLGAGCTTPHASAFAIDPSARTPPFGKRTSLQVGSILGTNVTLLGPPQKSNHRRQSSASEPGHSTTSTDSHSSRGTSAENSPALSRQPSEQEHARLEVESATSRRASHRQSIIYMRPTESLLNPLGAELENLRQELVAVHAELTETRKDLWEANEAKEASDACLRALKDFINENNIGTTTSPGVPSYSDSAPITLRGISLPPLPSDNIADEDEEQSWTRTPVATHAQSASVSKKGWGLGFWGSSTPVAESSSSATIKSPSGNDGVSPSSTSLPQSAKSPILSSGSLSSFVSKWRISGPPITVPNPTPPNANASLSPSNFIPAFKWNSSAPQTSVDDNYTSAPKPGSIRRRPSTYSLITIDTGNNSPGSRESPVGSLRDQDVIEVDEPRSATVESPVEDIRRSRKDQYIDSTPSLTDTETTAASVRGSSGPPSPKSIRRKLLSALDDLEEMKEIRPKPSDGSLPRTLPQTRWPSSSPSKISNRRPMPDLPPPTISPRNTEFGRTRVPISPKTKVPEVPQLPLTEGRKRARSRAASNAVVSPGIDTIVESAGSIGKTTLVRESTD